MLSFHDRDVGLCGGFSRREMLRVGGLGLGGLSWVSLLASKSHAIEPSASAPQPNSFGKAKSVIICGFIGGTPQHETWNPKPDAPEEIRGEFGSIDTKTPGLRIGELLPMTAKWTDKIAVLRAIVTNDNAHSSSGYQMLTGIPHQPLNRESAPANKPPNDAPGIGAIARTVFDAPGRLPSAITLPEHIWNDGNVPWPGQDAGFLGQRHDPWLIHCNPHQENFDIPALKFPDGIGALQFDQRRTLLEQLNQHMDSLKKSQAVQRYGVHAQQALDMLCSGKARSAFDLSQEPDKVRDRYGRSRFSQSILLARRLVEAGVPLIQVNWTRIKGFENQGGWDTHKKHNESLKKLLLPRADQVFTALLEDLEARGLLDETLVIWFSEFGHTPKFNSNAGRDHWGHAFSLALAGGGIRGGVVHGSTDGHAAYPLDGVVRPSDLIATIFHCLGFTPETMIRDPFGRPLPISRGDVIEAIV